MLLEIERTEREHLEEKYKRRGEYASGYCSACGSDEGLDDGEPCGHCAEGIKLLEDK
jgi:hypothetical protein